MNSGSEAELIDRCLLGDAEAWDALFDLHYTATGRFVAKLGIEFTTEDIEEICQETFLTVIKSLGSFKRNARFQTWLFRIAANKARDYRQKRTAAKRGGGQITVPLVPDPDTDDGPVDPPSPQPSPDLSLIRSEQIELVGLALRQLGDSCQEIIELRYFADLSYEEISNFLQLNPKTVSSRLSKCLDKLEAAARTVFEREKNTPYHV